MLAMYLQGVLQVPAQDAVELAELARAVGSESETSITHPFDGETVAQLLIALSASTFPYFRTWLVERTRQRKGYKILIDGIEFSGYTEAEAVKLLQQLDPGTDA